MKALGHLLCYFGLFLIFTATFGSGGDFSVGGIAAGGLVTVIGIGLVQASISGANRRSDRHARKAFESGNFSGKALYLRPFGNDGKFRIENPSGNLFDWDQYDRPGADGLERLMGEAFGRTCVLVGAGGRGGAGLGYGSSGYLDDWQPRISQAIYAATWIVIVPSAQPGTLWEVGEILKRKALAKTVFIMPPTVPPMMFEGPVAYRQLWDSARAACSSSFSLKLPHYDPVGAVFTMSANGLGTRDRSTFDMRSPRHLAKAINSIL